MKKIILSILVLFVLQVNAQIQIEKFIPKEAILVSSFDAQKFNQKTNPIIGDSLDLMAVIFKKGLRSYHMNANDWSDLGIDPSKRAWFYICTSDTFNYEGLLFAVTDKGKFETLMTAIQNKTNRQSSDSYITYTYIDKTAFVNVTINNINRYRMKFGNFENYLSIEGVEKTDPNYSSSYGSYYYDYNYYGTEETATAEDYATTEEYAVVDSVAYDTEVETETEVTIVEAEGDSDEAIADTIPTGNQLEEEFEDLPLERYTGKGDYNAYGEAREQTEDDYAKREENRQRKEKNIFLILQNWAEYRNSQINAVSEKSSILTNEDFKKIHTHSKAEVNMFVDYGRYVNQIFDSSLRDASYLFPSYGMGRYYRNFFRSYMSLFKGMLNDTYMTGGLYFNELNVEMIVDTYGNEEMITYNKKVANKKFNKSMIKKLPGDSLIGLVSLCYNTQASLEEMPKFYNKILSNNNRGVVEGIDIRSYSQEIQAIVDVIATIIDEKAIAELFPGDAVFAVTGYKEKLRNSYTYELDSEYNYVRVPVVKKDRLPNFVYMYSVKNEELTSKLVRLLVKHKFMVEERGYFRLNERGIPNIMDIYIVINKGVFYLCNTREQLAIILGDKKASKVNKSITKMIKSSTLSAYVNNNIVVDFLPEYERDFKMFSEMKKKTEGNLGSMSLYQSRPKGDKITSKYVFNTPEKYNSSLSFFHYLIYLNIFK